MKEIKRNDFLFFQNEVLKDIKSLEIKVNEKISNLSKSLENTKLILEQKYENSKIKLDEITKTLETENLIGKIDDKLDKFNSRLEEINLLNKTKISTFQNDLSEACFKYDKIFLNNISSPGLIGDGCPFQTMRSFLEFVNSKIKELISSKERNTTEFRKYEEWVKKALGNFREEIYDYKNSNHQFLLKELKQYDKRSMDKMNTVEDKLSFIRIENGRYNYNLSKKSEELEEKLKSFYIMNDNIINIYNNCRKEFIQIKKKFSDLSDYFKDIKYTKYNISSKSIFDELSKKIKINKKQNQKSTESVKIKDELPSIEEISYK